MSMRNVQLIVAEGCNLRCSYCFEHFKRQRKLNFKTAKEAVDHYLTADDGYDEIMIDFMGGEPMIAFDLIKQVVEYVENQKWPKRYHFSMSTNGTLFNKKNMSWFIEHKHIFTPMLSFDGTKFIHDKNRSNSYDQIMENIDFFRNHWPQQSLHMTVDSYALPYLADGVFSILALGFPIDINLVFEDVWGRGVIKKRNMLIFEYELARLVDFYSEYPTLEPPLLVNLPLQNCLEPDRDPHTSWCGAGEEMVAIDFKGVRYPCHRFTGLSADKPMTLEEFCDPEVNQKVSHPCDTCQMIAACPTCQAYNWEANGSITNRVVHKCELLKLQMIATAAIQVNRINLLFAHRIPEEIKDEDLFEIGRLLNGARLAFTVLGNIPQAELKPYVTGEWPGGLTWERRIRWHESREHLSLSTP